MSGRLSQIINVANISKTTIHGEIKKRRLLGLSVRVSCSSFPMVLSLDGVARRSQWEFRRIPLEPLKCSNCAGADAVTCASSPPLVLNSSRVLLQAFGFPQVNKLPDLGRHRPFVPERVSLRIYPLCGNHYLPRTPHRRSLCTVDPWVIYRVSWLPHTCESQITFEPAMGRKPGFFRARNTCTCPCTKKQETWEAGKGGRSTVARLSVEAGNGTWWARWESNPGPTD